MQVPRLQALLSSTIGQGLGPLQSLNSTVSAGAEATDFVTFLSVVFAVLSLLLSTCALLGMVSASCRSRVLEVGIRSALGASPANLLMVLVGETLTICLAGLALGALASVWMLHVINSMVYGVATVEKYVLPGVLISIAGATLLIAVPQAWPLVRRAPHSLLSRNE